MRPWTVARLVATATVAVLAGFVAGVTTGDLLPRAHRPTLTSSALAAPATLARVEHEFRWRRLDAELADLERTVWALARRPPASTGR